MGTDTIGVTVTFLDFDSTLPSNVTVTFLDFDSTLPSNTVSPSNDLHQWRTSNVTDQHRSSDFTILLYTTYFDGKWPIELGDGVIECGQYKCNVSRNETKLQTSDAVVFHAWADMKSYIKRAQKYKRNLTQRWVFCNRESPDRKQFRDSIYNSVFNWTMTYKLNSDIWYPYGEVKPGIHRSGFDPKKNYLDGRDKSVMAVISNCNPLRLNIVKKLKQYIDVDIYGYCGKKLCHGCWSVFKKYKFFLSFENSICTDYITEKTYRNVYNQDLIPVILSGGNLSNPTVVPQGSFIDASKFTSAQKLANYLKQVGSNSTLYNKFFEWRAHWTTSDIKIESTEATCRICKKLHETSSNSVKIYENIGKWFDKTVNCKPYPKKQ